MGIEHRAAGLRRLCAVGPQGAGRHETEVDAAVALAGCRHETDAGAGIAAAAGAGAAAGGEVSGRGRGSDGERAGGARRDPQGVEAAAAAEGRRRRGTRRLHRHGGDAGLGAILRTVVGGAAAHAGVGEHRAAHFAAMVETEVLRQRRAAGDHVELNDAAGILRADPARGPRRRNVGDRVVVVEDQAVAARRHAGEAVGSRGSVHRGGGAGGTLTGAAGVGCELDVQSAHPRRGLGAVERIVVVGVVVHRAADCLGGRRERESAGDVVAGLRGEREARARAAR